MNLRELVATLETGGKPELSEDPVMVLTSDGVIYEIKNIVFESSQSFDGLPDGGSITWLKVEEV